MTLAPQDDEQEEPEDSLGIPAPGQILGVAPKTDPDRFTWPPRPSLVMAGLALLIAIAGIVLDRPWVFIPSFLVRPGSSCGPGSGGCSTSVEGPSLMEVPSRASAAALLNRLSSVTPSRFRSWSRRNSRILSLLEGDDVGGVDSPSLAVAVHDLKNRLIPKGSLVSLTHLVKA